MIEETATGMRAMVGRKCDAKKAAAVRAPFVRLPNALRTNPGGRHDPVAAYLAAEERGFRLRATLLAELMRGHAVETRPVCVALPLAVAPRFTAPLPACRPHAGRGFLERDVPARARRQSNLLTSARCAL